MPNKKRIWENTLKGFTLVKELETSEVYKKQDSNGRWAYYSNYMTGNEPYLILDMAVRLPDELDAVQEDLKESGAIRLMEELYPGFKQQLQNSTRKWAVLLIKYINKDITPDELAELKMQKETNIFKKEQFDKVTAPDYYTNKLAEFLAIDNEVDEESFKAKLDEYIKNNP